ncbi:hypothetical protein CTM50_03710 [Prevotella intermedia]|uniref:Uncharacterized protein n=1 Tax=Prevotella intermedia TaxID=28131 RepID=A0A2D3N9W7_PREIN|nr:hypothetical protein CTM50_03710 [Prevotella intermedia]
MVVVRQSIFFYIQCLQNTSFSSALLLFYTLFNIGKSDNKSINIFRTRMYRVTISLSMLCKTYCFAFQKRLFCMVKA